MRSRKIYTVFDRQAVRPASIMGASKRLAELILQARARNVTTRTIFRDYLHSEAAGLVYKPALWPREEKYFELDMGEPIGIVDVAKMMIRLSGLQVLDVTHPDEDIEIAFTGFVQVKKSSRIYI